MADLCSHSPELEPAFLCTKTLFDWLSKQVAMRMRYIYPIPLDRFQWKIGVKMMQTRETNKNGGEEENAGGRGWRNWRVGWGGMWWGKRGKLREVEDASNSLNTAQTIGKSIFEIPVAHYIWYKLLEHITSTNRDILFQLDVELISEMA